MDDANELRLTGRKQGVELMVTKKSLLLRALEEKGLEKGCLGIEKRRFPISSYEKLSKKLPKAEFADAARVFHYLRAKNR